MKTMAPHYTVLRIKRKVDAVPLASLFIEESERAKKRVKDNSHEPSSASQRGMFMLAETVAQDWDVAGPEAEAFQQRLQQLASQQEKAAPVMDSAAAPFEPGQQAAQAARRYRVIKPQPRSRSAAHRASPGQSRLAPRLGGEETSDDSSPGPAVQGLRFIDAHEVHTPAASTGPSTPTRSQRRADDADARYQALLAESLASRGNQAIPLRAPTLADRPTPQPSPRSALAISSSSAKLVAVPLKAEEDGDFVYDLYYRVLGGVADTASSNVGALMGYEDLFDDEASDSEPEPGDEADEDSNEEDFYRNDYPEEDVSSGGEDLEEPDRETYLQPVAHRRVYKYGDDADSDRDGFASSDEDDEEDAAVNGGMSRAFQKAFGLGRHSGLDEREGSGDEDNEMRSQRSGDAEEVGEVDQWRVMRDD